MPDQPTMLDQSCVTIEDFKPMYRECEVQPATKLVMFNARNNGIRVSFADEMCIACAGEVAQRLRESLPPVVKKQ